MNSADYKYVVLGLIFLEYISDTFEEKREELTLSAAAPTSELHVNESGLRCEVLEGDTQVSKAAEIMDSVV